MWGVNSFTYSFPTSPSYYVGFNGGSYGSGEQNTGFQAFNSVQQAATASILNMYSAVANVTFTQIAETSTLCRPYERPAVLTMRHRFNASGSAVKT